jgi:hypothetical protein
MFFAEYSFSYGNKLTDKPMEQFQHLSQSALVDNLSEYTTKYTRMRAEGGSEEEFNLCLQTIKYLTSEIESRKKQEPQDTEFIDNSQTIFFRE